MIIFSRNARGGNVAKVGVVLTDGQSQDNVAAVAEDLRNADVLMYAVGVTNLGWSRCVFHSHNFVTYLSRIYHRAIGDIKYYSPPVCFSITIPLLIRHTQKDKPRMKA